MINVEITKQFNDDIMYPMDIYTINFQIINYKSSAYEKFEDLEFTHNEQYNIDALGD